MSAQKGLLSLVLVSLLMWVAWYAYTLTQAQNPETSPALGAAQKAEDFGYTQCITTAEREYQINSDNGTNDPNQIHFQAMNAATAACATHYNRTTP